MFAVPDADARRFVYGATFEFSVNAKRWDASRFTPEIRPIIGWHFERYEIVNPIVDTAYQLYFVVDRTSGPIDIGGTSTGRAR